MLFLYTCRLVDVKVYGALNPLEHQVGVSSLGCFLECLGRRLLRRLQEVCWPSTCRARTIMVPGWGDPVASMLGCVMPGRHVKPSRGPSVLGTPRACAAPPLLTLHDAADTVRAHRAPSGVLQADLLAVPCKMQAGEGMSRVCRDARMQHGRLHGRLAGELACRMVRIGCWAADAWHAKSTALL